MHARTRIVKRCRPRRVIRGQLPDGCNCGLIDLILPRYVPLDFVLPKYATLRRRRALPLAVAAAASALASRTVGVGKPPAAPQNIGECMMPPPRGRPVLLVPRGGGGAEDGLHCRRSWGHRGRGPEAPGGGWRCRWGWRLAVGAKLQKVRPKAKAKKGEKSKPKPKNCTAAR